MTVDEARGVETGSTCSGSLTRYHTEGRGQNMAKKIVPENQNQNSTTSVCIPLYRLQVVKERHSPLYGAPKIADSSDVSRLLRAHFEGRPHEEFALL